MYTIKINSFQYSYEHDGYFHELVEYENQINKNKSEL